MVKHTLSPSDSTIPKRRAVIWKSVSSERQAHEEKVSLPEQERLARKWCEENSYEVIRVLEVPGYSRRESDVIAALEDFANEGIYAYHDLRRMWQNKEFEILVALSHDRLGRSNTLHSWVVENIILNGMQIYFLADGGFVDLEDFRYKIAIGGMLAATPIDRLIRAAAVAKDKLVLQGLPTGAKIPLSHRLVRDPESGKALYIELNPNYKQLFDDVATLFLEGVAYNSLSRELFQHYGHKDKRGKVYRHNNFFELFYTPTFWGHMARRYTFASVNGNMRGAWAFDENVEPPAGIIVARNVVPAVYTGDLADAIKAEIYRRMDIIGHRRPNNTYRFAGLFICGECGSGMSVKAKSPDKRIGLKCCSIYSRVRESDCTQNLLTTHRYLQAEMERLLKHLVEGASPDIFNPRHENETSEQDKIKALNQQKDKLQSQITALIMEQANAPEVTRGFYRQQIETLSNQFERVNEDLMTIIRKVEEEQYQSREELRTIEELRSLTLDCFWRLPDREINQWLRRMFGKRKFVIMDRQMVDMVEIPQKLRKSGQRPSES